MKRIVLAAFMAAPLFVSASDEQRLGQLMNSLDSSMQTLISQARSSTDNELKRLADETDKAQRVLQKALNAQKNSKATNPPGNVQGLTNALGKKMELLLQKAKNSTDTKIKQTAQSIEKTRSEINAIFDRLSAKQGTQPATDKQGGSSSRTLKKVK